MEILLNQFFFRYVVTFLLCIPAIYCSANQDTKTLMSLEQLHARGRIPHDEFVVNSIPKCGTHLIMSCIYHVLNKPVDWGYDYVSEREYTPGRAQNYLNFLETQKNIPYVHKTHVPYFAAMENTFLKANLKWIYIIRDPRDAIVSLVFYMKNPGAVFDFMSINPEIYNQLSIDERIEAVMTGSCCKNYLETYLRPFVGWTQSPYGLVVRFEDIIGPRGGGTLEKQLSVINEIASYLHVNLSDEEIMAAAEYTNAYSTPNIQVFLGASYNRGQIGNWKLFFNESNKKLFKELFGQELIELGYEQSNDW